MKTKALIRRDESEISQLDRNSVNTSSLDEAFESVEVLPEESGDHELAAEFHRLIGRQEVLGTFQAMTSALLAENLHRLAKSKYYKKVGLTFEEACQRLYPQLSIPSCYRRVQEYAEFGQGFFQLKDVVRISAGTYRLINATVEDGSVVVGSETYQLTKANAPYIQAAIQEQVQRLREQGDKLSHTQGALTKVREERDNARKAAEKAREDAEARRKREEEIYGDATENQRKLLKAQDHIRAAGVLIAAVTSHPLDDVDRGLVDGVVEWCFQFIGKVSGRDYSQFPMSLAEGRDLIEEYEAERLTKKRPQ